MPPPWLFLDANVLFTAALSPGGRSAGLVELAKFGKCTLLASRSRRGATSDSSPLVLSLDSRRRHCRGWTFSEAGTEAVQVGTERGLPLKDAPILGAAVQARADYLITGNSRHFGHLFGEQIGGATVLTPADALEALL